MNSFDIKYFWDTVFYLQQDGDFFYKKVNSYTFWGLSPTDPQEDYQDIEALWENLCDATTEE